MIGAQTLIRLCLNTKRKLIIYISHLIKLRVICNLFFLFFIHFYCFFGTVKLSAIPADYPHE